MFTERAEPSESDQPRHHPADLVLEAFKDPQTAELTCQKLKTFLEDLHKVHGKDFDCAAVPAAWSTWQLLFFKHVHPLSFHTLFLLG